MKETNADILANAKKDLDSWTMSYESKVKALSESLTSLRDLGLDYELYATMHDYENLNDVLNKLEHDIMNISVLIKIVKGQLIDRPITNE